MTKKTTRLQKSSKILTDVKAVQWCYVNTENEFVFMDNVFIIDKKVKEYKVYHKSFEYENYTNEAEMEEILVVIDNDNNLKFYNQNYDLIDSKLVKVEE